jgi:hypothetical protein
MNQMDLVDSDDDLSNIDLREILQHIKASNNLKPHQQQQQYPPSSLSSTESQNSNDSVESFIPLSQCVRVTTSNKQMQSNKENLSQQIATASAIHQSKPVKLAEPLSVSQFQQTLTMDSQQQMMSMDAVSQTSQMKRARFLESDFLKSTNPFVSENTLTTQHVITTQTQQVSSSLKAKKAAIENSFYGLPNKVRDLLKQLRNISSLYDWQDELLGIMQDKYEIAWNNLQDEIDDDLFTNLLYLSPTSAGKTLVAEMIILHCLLIRKKNCIFVMPFVSIVQEKVQSIAEFAEALNFIVEEYAGVKGRMPPLKRQTGKGKCTLYICTIEKAHSLVNSLIESDRLADEIGLVVADELHMIGDGSRGAIYEMILSKINYSSENILIRNKTVSF